jgi:hypothetical protein
MKNRKIKVILRIYVSDLILFILSIHVNNRLSFFNSYDIRTKGGKFFLDRLIAAVEVIDA